jgi:hypothetical protein
MDFWPESSALGTEKWISGFFRATGSGNQKPTFLHPRKVPQSGSHEPGLIVLYGHLEAFIWQPKMAVPHTKNQHFYIPRTGAYIGPLGFLGTKRAPPPPSQVSPLLSS